jgi:hypothetical protein
MHMERVVPDFVEVLNHLLPNEAEFKVSNSH